MKKAKYIIVGVILLAAIVFYSFIDKMNFIFDNSIDNSSCITTVLSDDVPAVQSFTCCEKSLDGVNVKFMVSGDMSNVDVCLTCKDESGNIVGTSCVKADKIKSGKYSKFKFDKVNDTLDKIYTVELLTSGIGKASDEKPEDRYVAIYYEPVTVEGTQLTLSGEHQDGTAIMKSITHRFDLETFIVVAAIVAFIVYYMKVLYKLFR